MTNWNLLNVLVLSSAIAFGVGCNGGGTTGDDTNEETEDTEDTEETGDDTDPEEAEGMVPDGMNVSGFFGWDPETETVIPYTVDGETQNPLVVIELTEGTDSCVVFLTANEGATITTEIWDQTDEDTFDGEDYDIVHTGFILTPDTYTMETDCELSSDWGTVEELLGEDGWGIGVGNVRGDVDAEWAAAVEEDPELEETYDSLLGAGIYLGALEGSDWAPSGYIGFNYGFGFELDDENAIVMDGDAPVNLSPDDVISESGELPHGAYGVQPFGGLVFQ